MKEFLVYSSSHGRHAGAGYPGQWVGLCPVEGPLCTPRFSFVIKLRELLVNREISIPSGFRHQLLLELSGKASCLAPGDSEAHGKVFPLLSGEKKSCSDVPTYASRKGVPASSWLTIQPSLSELPGPPQIILLIAPSLWGVYQNVNRRHFVFARCRYGIMGHFFYLPIFNKVLTI